jgi:NADPH:quinone reductase-like Zn-dependent oxidoreductase
VDRFIRNEQGSSSFLKKRTASFVLPFRWHDRMPLSAVLNPCGDAKSVVSLSEMDDPQPAAADEILVDMCLSPINPADLLMIAGNYGIATDLPAHLGAEGVGVVSAAGANTAFVPGRLVMPLVRGCWAQRLRLPAHAAIPLPAGVSLTQAAMLRINPATARRLLSLASLSAGDIVLQIAGASMVGRCVAILAASLGVRCCSVVRAVGGLIPVHGEMIVEDGPDLPDRVAALTGGAPIRLALDCVAGAASGRLAACLAHGGTLAVYGHLSGSPCEIPSTLLTSRGLVVRGFSLRPAEAGMTHAALADFYRDVAYRLRDFTPPIVATYRLRDIQAALRHAAAPGHRGKILLDLS